MSVNLESLHFGNDYECSICKEGCGSAIEGLGHTTTSRVDHVFHIACLDAWLKSGHKSCPICRKEFEGCLEGSLIEDAEENPSLEERVIPVGMSFFQRLHDPLEVNQHYYWAARIREEIQAQRIMFNTDPQRTILLDDNEHAEFLREQDLLFILQEECYIGDDMELDNQIVQHMYDSYELLMRMHADGSIRSNPGRLHENYLFLMEIFSSLEARQSINTSGKIRRFISENLKLFLTGAGVMCSGALFQAINFMSVSL